MSTKSRLSIKISTLTLWRTFLNRQENEDWMCEKIAQDPSEGQCASSFRFVCVGVLCEKLPNHVGSSTVLARRSPLCLLVIFTGQIAAEGDDLRAWTPSKKKRRRLSTSCQKRISSTVMQRETSYGALKKSSRRV